MTEGKKQKRVLIACDSFKGSLSSEQVGKCIKRALKKKNIPSDYLIISDGGEGYTDALKFGRPSLEKRYLVTCDALFRPKRAPFLKDGDSLYFCLADVAGIHSLKRDEINAYETSTYGLGYAMRKAVSKFRPKRVFLSVGGSATVDLGLGMLEGLGAKFYGGAERLTEITLKDFDRITRIELTDALELTSGIRFTVLTDVDNPLLGQNGAAFVYGEQKGLKKSELARVDKSISRVKDALLFAEGSASDPSDESGSGAAGGVGFTMRAVFGAEIKSGIDELLSAVEFGERIKNYDVVITGEGKFDEQSLNGKVVCGVTKYGIKDLIIVCAITTLDRNNVYSIVPRITTKERSMKEPEKYLSELIDSVF